MDKGTERKKKKERLGCMNKAGTIFGLSFQRTVVILLLFALLFSFFTIKTPIVSHAEYVNTNFNTFIHDTAELQKGYPGEEMQIHVRIGFNGINGLNNPPTEEIQNIRVRLSSDQSYLNDTRGPAVYRRENPYDTDDQAEEADAWEEGYDQGRRQRSESNYYYELVGGLYPFEVNASLFTQEKQVESLKIGEYIDMTFNVRVRSDALTMKNNEGNTSDGYFGIPFTIWYEIPPNSTGHSGRFNKTEFINVFIENKGEILNPSTQTRDQAFVIGEDQGTPVGTYPNVMDYSVNFRNQTNQTLYDVVVKLNTSLAEGETVQLTEQAKSEAVRDFPFDINEANYDKSYESIESGDSISVPYSMAIKQNIATGFYPLSYTVSYKTSPGASLSSTENYTFFVNIKNPSMIEEEEEETKTEFNENDRTRARIVVDSFYTEPEKVMAGESFRLILNMKNASSDISASNLQFTLTSAKADDTAVFNIEGGANSVVVNSLPAGSSTSLSFDMTAAAGVDPKSYAITIEEKYDSPEYKNAVEKVDIDINVNQVSKLSVSNMEVSPESVQVGEETNIMFGINNTGKVVLYNVQAIFEAETIKAKSSYVGNIEPGKTGNVDIMLSAVSATMDDGVIPILIKYEDVNGVEYTESTEVNLYVTEEFIDFEDYEWEDMDVIEEESAVNLPLIIAVASVALLCLLFILRKIWKARRKKEEEEDEII